MSFMKHELDAVVTVDTAVAHMAASVGVETHMMVGCKAVDWRWQTGDGETCWYPSMKLYLQKNHGDWNEVLGRVKDNL